MNESYIKPSSGNVIVFDENNNPKEVEYSDNLDEILAQKNVIEKIENKIKDLEKELKEIYGNASQKEVNKRRYFSLGLPICIVSFVFPPIISYLNGNADIFTTVNNSILGPISEALSYSLSFSLLGVPFGAVIDFFGYTDHKQVIREFNAKTSELEALRKLLPNEKAKLNELNLNRTNKQMNRQFGIVSAVNDTKQLNDLENFCTFHYNLGYNLDTYHKALQKGTLETLLQQEGYDAESIKIITNYVKEKSSVLTKKSLKELRTSLKKNRISIKVLKTSFILSGLTTLLATVIASFNVVLSFAFITSVFGIATIATMMETKEIKSLIITNLQQAEKRVNYINQAPKSAITHKRVQTRILPKKATTYDNGNRLVRKLTKDNK